MPGDLPLCICSHLGSFTGDFMPPSGGWIGLASVSKAAHLSASENNLFSARSGNKSPFRTVVQRTILKHEGNVLSGKTRCIWRKIQWSLLQGRFPGLLNSPCACSWGPGVSYSMNEAARHSRHSCSAVSMHWCGPESRQKMTLLLWTAWVAARVCMQCTWEAPSAWPLAWPPEGCAPFFLLKVNDYWMGGGVRILMSLAILSCSAFEGDFFGRRRGVVHIYSRFGLLLCRIALSFSL